MTPLTSTFPRMAADARDRAEVIVGGHLFDVATAKEEGDSRPAEDHAELSRQYQLLADHHRDQARK